MSTTTKPDPLMDKAMAALVQPLPPNPTLADRIRFSQQVDTVRQIHRPQETRVGA